jgi:hypothetical protein
MAAPARPGLLIPNSSLMVPCALPAFVRIFVQSSRDYVLKRRGNRHCYGGDRRRILLKHCRGYTDLGLAFERPLARHHLVEHRSKGKDIGTRVRLFSLDLLRAPCIERFLLPFPRDCERTCCPCG